MELLAILPNDLFKRYLELPVGGGMRVTLKGEVPDSKRAAEIVVQVTAAIREAVPASDCTPVAERVGDNTYTITKTRKPPQRGSGWDNWLGSGWR